MRQFAKQPAFLATNASDVNSRSQPEAAATLADELVRELVNAGVKTYFGVPGGTIEPLFNALERQHAAGLVRVVPMRSEAGAAFAADGYYRETGRIAACAVTSGPGISNLLTATMSAHADRIPMLLLTPQVASHKQGRGAQQESSLDGYDLTRMLASCTRYSTLVSHPDQLGHKLARALATAKAAPAGPVHLSLPSDLLAGRPSRRSPGASDRAPNAPAPELVDALAVEELVQDVLRARAPVILIGDDAGAGAARALELGRRLGCAVVSSPAGKRWIGHLDPQYRGVVGFSGHPEARQALESTDLVLALGATFDEFSTNAWTALPDVPILAVDRHAEFAYRMPNAQPVVAEVSHVLQRLLDSLRGRPRAPRPGRSSGLRARVRPSDEGAVHPARLMHWLSSTLPEDVVVHVDAGSSYSWSTRDLLRARPDTYRVAMGLSSMCWAISAAIGAAVARPRRTLCVTGDGSMLMSSLELTVAVEQKLPVTFLILNDSGLGMVRHGQRLSGGRPIAHDITPVRFDQLARACGAHGLRINSGAELEALQPDWLEHDHTGPCVIDVHIDREAVPPLAERIRGLAESGSR